MSDFSMRYATLGDLDAIKKLTNKTGVREFLPFILRATFEHDIAQYEAGLNRHHVMVVHAGELLVGYTRFLHRKYPVNGMIQTTGHETAVHPNFRGRGIGQGLFDARLAAMHDYAGNNPARLFFKAKANNPAHAFFIKNKCQMIENVNGINHYERVVVPSL